MSNEKAFPDDREKQSPVVGDGDGADYRGESPPDGTSPDIIINELVNEGKGSFNPNWLFPLRFANWCLVRFV
jgi:hypothetical protein